MNASITGPCRSSMKEASLVDHAGISDARCMYGQRVALELSRLRMGPVLGEHPDRARLRVRIGRWYGAAVEQPAAVGQLAPQSTPAFEPARISPAPYTHMSTGANCVLS